MNPSQNTVSGGNEGYSSPDDLSPKLKFTQEELQVLKQCDRESFWYRCIPFMAFFGGTSHMLVKRGILKPHPRYGSMIKVAGSSLVGYFVGKFSYQDACRQKIMQLENSPLAEAMRRGKRGSEIFQEISRPHIVPLPGGDSDTYSTSERKLTDDYSATDVDTDSNVQHKGLDDTFRPSVDGSSKNQPHEEHNQKYTSYDELRQRNRAEYEKRVSGVTTPSGASSQRFPKVEPPAGDTLTSSSPEIPYKNINRSSSADKQTRVRRNQYGDIIED